MAAKTFIEKQEENITQHIFSVSAAMVGVCLTVIGIINVIASYNNNFQTVADDITVVDAVLFLITCILSYIAIKTKNRKKRLKLEMITDILFLIALSIMAGTCLILVYFFYFKRITA